MQANTIFRLTYELRIAISFDDSVIVGASGLHLYIWDVSTEQSRPSIRYALIKDVAFSNDGKLILIASRDFSNSLILYDLVNMKQKKVYFMKATSEPVRVAFMYNNKGTEVIMCIFKSGIVNIYSIDGGSPLTTFNICPRMCRRDFLFARKSFVCQAGEKLLCYTADGKEIKIPAPEKSPTAFALANISHFDLFQTLNILKKNELYLPKHVMKMIGYYEKIC
jgi:WD40 repeat protein